MRFFPILIFATVPAMLYSKPNGAIDRLWFNPVPQALTFQAGTVPFPTEVSIVGVDPSDPAAEGTVETLRDLAGLIPAVSWHFGGGGGYRIDFVRNPAVPQPEGYSLVSSPAGVRIEFSSETGRYYGAQTLYQLLAYSYWGWRFAGYSETFAEGPAAEPHVVPNLSIEDHPAYALRSVMVDLGRTPYSMALLKRVIRIMGQLKLNQLHLHLYDDQLCSFRFANLPLGHDNPFALDAAQLKELVHYARVRQVAVMPELESWGHVQSVVRHYPELRGGAGVYGGASFAVGDKTYALLERMYDEIVPCLENQAAVHVGLDEAQWSVLPGEQNRDETPSRMVGKIYDTLMRVAAKHHQEITMHLWADHGGRPLPPEVAGKVVIEPWKYLGAEAAAISKTLADYGGPDKGPMMMGAGASSTAAHGTYEATRVWCTEGLKYPNVRGVTLCLWESNDVAGRLITIYGGAAYAWAPTRVKNEVNDPLGEKLRYRFDGRMHSWQLLFPPANPAGLDADRGPEVKSGLYLWPPLMGRPVSTSMDVNHIAP